MSVRLFVNSPNRAREPQMASNSSKNTILPVSEPEKDEEKERLLKGEEKLFKGSAMTKRGAAAAISYMACAVLLGGVICGPFLLIWTFLHGDLERTINFPSLFSPGILDLFTIGLGWIVFGGLPFDFLNVVGQFLGFLGSGLYAYYKLIGK